MSETFTSQARDLYHRVRALHPEERVAFLSTHPTASPRTRQLVVDLLESDDPSAGPYISGELARLALPGFRFLGVLGVGATSVVFHCEREGDGEEVAIKVLREERLAPSVRKRFDRECRLLQSLDHPNIARFHDAGSVEADGVRRRFLVMELVDGVPLTQFARDHGLTVPARVELLKQLARGLGYSQQHGVVHRDLKPANILVRPDGRLKILDFGVAAVTDAGTTQLTEFTDGSQLVGTLAYMSPEQVSASVDRNRPCVDVFAFGAIAYELLGGRRPIDIEGLKLPEAVAAILHAEIPTLSSRNPDIASSTAHVVHRCLERDPARRYASLSAVVDDLGRIERGLAPARVPRSRFRGRRGARIAAGAVLASVVIAALFWLWPSGRGEAVEIDSLCATLEELDARRHLPSLTPDHMHDLLDGFEAAYVRAQELSSASARHELGRFILWRRGELHYFLGTRLRSPDEIHRAMNTWSRMRPPVLDPELRSRLSRYLQVRLADVGFDSQYNGMALAAAKLASWMDPVVNMTIAVDMRDRAWRVFAQEFLDGDDPLRARFRNESDREPHQARMGVCLVGLGQANVRLGYYSHDRARLDQGIRLLERDRAEGFSAVETRGAGRHALALARLYEYEITGDAMLLTSALTAVEEALGYRTRTLWPAEFAESVRLWARIQLAEWDATPPEAEVYAAQLRDLEADEEYLAGHGLDELVRRHEVVANLIRVRRGLADDDRVLWESALEGLDANAHDASHEELPHGRANAWRDWIEARVWVAEAGFQATDEIEMTARLIEDARRILPRSQHAGYHEALDRAQERLGRSKS